jgi:hypothetical protein
VAAGRTTLAAYLDALEGVYPEEEEEEEEEEEGMVGTGE